MLGRMQEHPNAELARRVWEALSRGDAESFRELLAPDVVWHAASLGTPWSGTHRGYEAVVDFLADIGERTDVADSQWRDVLVSDRHVLVVYHVSLRVAARRAEIDYAWLVRVEKGRLAEVWTLPLDPAAVEMFWSEGSPDGRRRA
jgi:ketosteroid isomerase-like protein